jgi:hypothetical protein
VTDLWGNSCPGYISINWFAHIFHDEKKKSDKVIGTFFHYDTAKG